MLHPSFGEAGRRILVSPQPIGGGQTRWPASPWQPRSFAGEERPRPFRPAYTSPPKKKVRRCDPPPGPHRI